MLIHWNLACEMAQKVETAIVRRYKLDGQGSILEPMQKGKKSTYSSAPLHAHYTPTV